MISIILFIFVFGVIIGSFLNVAALRFNTGVTLQGRSFCVFCHRTLRSTELIPLVSFFIQKGRCRGCKGKISWQYPLVELFTGIIFVTLYLAQTPTTLMSWCLFFLSLVIFSIYIVILIYDTRHKIIPDILVYSSIVLAILYRILIGGSFGDWLAGPFIFIFFALVWLLTRGKAMGFGDAKLGLSIGILLGLSVGLSAIVLSFWIGTAVVVTYMVLRKFIPLSKGDKRLTMKSEIPFAPFMIIGAWISMIFELDLLYVNFF